jgi:homoserine O-acetyltransferase
MSTATNLSHPARAEPRLGIFSAAFEPALGGTVAHLPVPYALYGALGGEAPPAVVLGGISSDREVGRWWGAQLAPGGALDVRERAVIGLDFLAERPPGWRAVSPRDQARRVLALLDHLGVERAVLIGASYGGAVALAFAAAHPERLAAALVIAMAHRPHPQASALRGIQREIVRFGLSCGRGREALALARALAVTSYRSEREFEERFPGSARFDAAGIPRRPIEAYLRAQGERFAERFSPERFLTLSESLDLHEEDPAKLQGSPLHLLAVVEDRLVPLADLKTLAEEAQASLTVLSSRYGHDAFLKEERLVGAWLQAALARAPCARRGDQGFPIAA